MTKGRLEAFSDGVIAVIITIMVLELKVPHDSDPKALMPLVPVFLSYLLSFVFVGIYWNNHHHMFHAVHHVNGATLWANLHLLFWLSLVPFVTGWMDENHFAAQTVAAYGFVRRGVRLHHPDARASGDSCQGFAARQGSGEGLQGKDLDRHLRRRASARLRAPLDRVRPVRAGGRDLALPRPALRKTARRVEGVAGAGTESGIFT